MVPFEFKGLGRVASARTEIISPFYIQPRLMKSHIELPINSRSLRACTYVSKYS